MGNIAISFGGSQIMNKGQGGMVLPVGIAHLILGAAIAPSEAGPGSSHSIRTARSHPNHIPLQMGIPACDKGVTHDSALPAHPNGFLGHLEPCRTRCGDMWHNMEGAVCIFILPRALSTARVHLPPPRPVTPGEIRQTESSPGKSMSCRPSKCALMCGTGGGGRGARICRETQRDRRTENRGLTP